MPTQQIYQAPQKSFWMRAVFAFLKREYNIISNICPLPLAAHTFLDKYTLAAAQQYILCPIFWQSWTPVFSIYMRLLFYPFASENSCWIHKSWRGSSSLAQPPVPFELAKIFTHCTFYAHIFPVVTPQRDPCDLQFSVSAQELANIFFNSEAHGALKHLKKVHIHYGLLNAVLW